MPFTALQVTRNAKLTGNKELQRLQGPLGVGAQELKGATQLGRGLRSTAPPPTPAGQTPAGRGLASASKAAKAPAAKTPAPKTSATAAKGRAPASVAKAKQAAAQQGGKAGAGKVASKTKRRMLPKVRRLQGAEVAPAGQTTHVISAHLCLRWFHGTPVNRTWRVAISRCR